jgi:ATPase subunit of ABC transporter with duplicated ATPase domains
MARKLYISTNSIGFRHRLKQILKDISVTIHQGDKIALVGDNGTGKTTLLKIIAHLISPSQGKVEELDSVWYLPQLDLEIFQSNIHISDYIAQYIEDWWEVIELIEHTFDFSINPTRELATLSGGEIVKLHLGIIFYIKPKVLLLDEPTNHLDIQAQEWLIKAIQAYPYSVLIASHDTSFADRVVNRVWELEDGSIREFGGNVSFYREQKRLEGEARLRRYEVALKDKKRLDKSVASEAKRQEQNIQVGIKSRQDRSVSRMDRGYLKSKAQMRAGQKKLMYDSRLEDNKEILHELEPQIRRDVRYYIPHQVTQNQEIILDIRDGMVQIADTVLIRDIRFQVSNGDRIALIGGNGTGKSQFFQMIMKRQLSAGILEIKDTTHIVYMDQTYAIVSPHKTILENMRDYNPKASILAIRQKLREFLFWDDYQVNQYAENLSGGQVARLAFAMISLQQVDILLLDEPTNNLDISTQEAIIQGLLGYKGALIIISHSIDFLNRVGIQDIYCIAHKQYIKHPYTIEDERFHTKLLEIIGNGIVP